jgi:WD40 repeat protein
MLAAADGDGTITLWNKADPARPHVLGRPFRAADSAGALALSRDGRILAAGIADGTILLWHLAGAAPLQNAAQTITASVEPVNAVALSPDGRVLASGSNDGGIRLCTLNARYTIQQICATTGDELTRRQWDRDVSAQLPYRPPC